MLKVLVSCANGSGTSLMMKMTAEKALKGLGINGVNVHHCALSEGKSTAINYDLVFCPLNFIDMFKDSIDKGVRVIGIKNVLSEPEFKQKLSESGYLEDLKNK
ncbi:PTS ascorbate transporter subunit IIB [Brachyspira hampsonii]|uniref:PTS ascorbate transporter subunit IIB n=1 Tax=Brachyspira hampsonii TaxID=1287055 RepID=A0A1E5ND89_9SPIR|nr:PTS sugar transporter subunit IIB [Brachyspira hampsonii]OEJ14130.1 PTS ascorbate transporter subunit IIB [Brachyspira hampsonii]